MAAWTLTLLPVLAGAGVWAGGARCARTAAPSSSARVAVAALVATLVLAVLAAIGSSTGTYAVGSGLTMRVALVAPATVGGGAGACRHRRRGGVDRRARIPGGPARGCSVC